ncbi:MAG TPA: flagellar biosynthesis protein FliQ [Anaerolineae bacterium]|nr:flagellar biosynthesis protein FliQ [Anaerolineae bacterium]HRV90564.1 flagellar biosynthesis protein FliQ [Anaerolineae bacterium]
MTESFVMTLGRDALMMTLLLGAPMLGVSLVVGLVVSLFQAVTQINEMTLTFVPKLLALTLVFVLLGPWMLQQIIHFTVRLFEMLPYMVQ